MAEDEQEQKTRAGGADESDIQNTIGDKECPECGEPVDDVRATCKNCGYEYQEDDYTDKEAGSEFVAGTAVDDEGNEIPDDETGS